VQNPAGKTRFGSLKGGGGVVRFKNQKSDFADSGACRRIFAHPRSAPQDGAGARGGRPARPAGDAVRQEQRAAGGRCPARQRPALYD